MRMRRNVYIVALIATFVSILVCILGALGALVTLKYDSDFTNDLFSFAVLSWGLGVTFSLLSFFALLIFRKRILRSANGGH
jgi:uncharacterized membrane protein